MDSFRDTSDEAGGIVRAATWIVAGIGMFLMATCMTWTELEYAIFGEDVRATITDVREVRTKKSDVLMRLRVDYSFVESGGKQRRGYQEVANDWAIPADGMVMVQYTPGEDGTSRFVGHFPWFWVVVFFASLAIVVCGFIIMTRKPNP